MNAKPVLIIDCTVRPSSGQVFTHAMRRMAPPHTKLDVHRATLDQPESWEDRAVQGAYSALVISGSAVGVGDRVRWVKHLAAPLRAVVASGLPTLGICFGHQLVAHAFGGRVHSGDHKVRGIRAVATHPNAESLLCMQGHQEALVSHTDQVIEPPPGWEVLAHSDYCPVQALRAPGLALLTVQWHPEADRAFIEDNPDPAWDELGDRRLKSLPANRLLTSFLEDPSKLAPEPNTH